MRKPYDPSLLRDPTERSYMGQYGLVGSAWAAWLLRQRPELLAMELEAFEASRAPDCPSCGKLMVWRPGEFVCYRVEHVQPVRVKQEIELPRAPAGDVLGRVGEPLDCKYDVRTGKLVIVEGQFGEPS